MYIAVDGKWIYVGGYASGNMEVDIHESNSPVSRFQGL